MDPRIAEDLRRIDAAAQLLGNHAAPPELCTRVLEAVAQEPQEENPAANSPIWRWIAAATTIAVAALALFMVMQPNGTVGDKANFVPRGVEDAAMHTVGVRLAVQPPHNPSAERFSRGKRYDPGTVLFFRYDAGQQTVLHLIRVDAAGATLLHTQVAAPGSADLMTAGDLVGYELEIGEGPAVFALIAHSEPLQDASVFAVDPEVQAVCAAAAALGAGCAAERVESP